MQITVTVKLNTTAEQFTLLVETVKMCNTACDWISEIAFSERNFRQYDLHERAYYAARETFKLPSCHTARCISKVANAYKLDKAVPRTFRLLGAAELDKNLLTWKVDAQVVNIKTLKSRLNVPFACSPVQKELLQGKRGQADLVLRNGVFYLCVAVTVQEAALIEPTGVIGVDLGIVNVATDSEGNTYTGEPVKKVRKKYRRLRQLLQPKKTRSARKHLQKARRKESRFVKDVNHCISKKLVQLALMRQKALAIETLTGIRKRGNGLNRAMRAELNNWTFHQLKTFLTYKARRAGIPLVEVDPRYSSQTCSACGHCERANRKSQEGFCCVCCGLKLNADYNAALNLKARGELSPALMFRKEALASA